LQATFANCLCPSCLQAYEESEDRQDQILQDQKPANH
jgi:hypothetical protein